MILCEKNCFLKTELVGSQFTLGQVALGIGIALLLLGTSYAVLKYIQSQKNDNKIYLDIQGENDSFKFDRSVKKTVRFIKNNYVDLDNLEESMRNEALTELYSFDGD